jgi:AcrR family transcriptional regulator
MTTGTAIHDTRSRLLDTALKLFSEHGVEGTSLQMIADALGVTKAAVYYHFKTKDEIVSAIVGPPVRELDQVLDVALSKRGRSAQIDHALQGLVDLIVRHRSLFGLISSDLGIRRVVKTTSEAAKVDDVTRKMQMVFGGAAPNLADAIAVHVVFAGLSMVGGDLQYAGIDNETLRQHLLDVGRRLLGRPRR